MIFLSNLYFLYWWKFGKLKIFDIILKILSKFSYMKIKLALLIAFLSFWINQTFASFWSELFDSFNEWSSQQVIYCENSEECWIDKWVDIVKNWINWLETTITFSQFVQNIITYLLTFISIIAVIYIIYAWFNILVSRWSEDVQKKQKSTIVSIVIWMVIIWLSYSIVTFIINLANQWGWTN